MLQKKLGFSLTRARFISRIVRPSDKTTRSSLSELHRAMALVDMHLQTGKVEMAEDCLKHFLRSGVQLNNRIFNEVMLGWAEKGNQFKVQSIYRTMLRSLLEPDAQTYAALLIQHIRTKSVSYIPSLLENIKAEGIHLEHLPYEASLSTRQKQYLKEALHYSASEFHAKVPIFDGKHYIADIVSDLYGENGQLITCDLQSKRSSFSLEGIVRSEDLKRKLKSQLTTEKRGSLIVKTVVPSDAFDTESAATLSSLRDQWQKVLTDAVFEQKPRQRDRRLKLVVSPEAASNATLLFKILNPSKMVDILLDKVFELLLQQSDGMAVRFLCFEVGHAIEQTYEIWKKSQNGEEEKILSMYIDYIDYYFGSNRCDSISQRAFWEELDCFRPWEASLSKRSTHWPFSIHIHLVGYLLNCLVENAEFTPTGDVSPVAAFTHEYQVIEERKVGHIKAHPDLLKLYKAQSGLKSEFPMRATVAPMLVPPRPWISIDDGGYLVTPIPIMRVTRHVDAFQHWKVLEENGDKLKPVLDALNYISSCPWKINKSMLKVVEEIFNKGGDDDLGIPSGDLPDLPEFPADEEDVSKRREFFRLRRALRKERLEKNSLRMDMVYRLSLARHFENDVFWLPSNMDFRGRAYTVPPHLTHLGGDIARCLLLFGKGERLGEHGLAWLKIHLANLRGTMKKASLEARVKYAEDSMENILDSADNPLTGRGWWRSADEPLQCLACCFEIAEAIRSGEPSSYVSHLPVHQDGSCNGLQHYAAMGRDVEGGYQVNLSASDVPQDVYSGVLRLVEAKRAIDAENGVEIAMLLDGKVNRKVIKQTVMTIVYGVTFVGGREQIKRQLKDQESVDTNQLFSASTYLVKLVFDCLGEIFENARLIQDWLTESAKKIAASGQPVQWTTPLGLPIIQPYHKPYRKEVKTGLQRIENVSKSDISLKPDRRKQRSAFPPNFVHSLDATHMMLTALHCQRNGVTFAAVHDSFWTHAATVDIMNEVCRKQFIDLHSAPILEQLAEQFNSTYGTDSNLSKIEQVSFDDLPRRGSLNLEDVKRSIFFFS